MAKELPYFRFTVQEWQNGDIAIESYELKGLFIDLCGFYWIKDCNISLVMLQKRFSNAKDLLEQLISLEIIKLDKNGNIEIAFLNEQFDLLSEKRKNRQLAGKKGGLSKASNAKAMLKQNPSYKDKDKDNNNNKAFVADANVDVEQYREYLFNILKERQISIDILMKNTGVYPEWKNEVWDSFIKNNIVQVPLIENEKHAYNCFKKFIYENAKSYNRPKKVLQDNNWD